MTKKPLILGVVTLCALPAAALAQTLLSENFDELSPRMRFSGMIGQFTGTNVRINGNLNGPPVLHPLCTGALSGNCAQLNAVTGRMQSIEVTLEPGNTYSLSFALTGNPSISTAVAPARPLTCALASTTTRSPTPTCG
jgi:hypothetical protein